MKNALYEEIDRLKRVNGELVAGLNQTLKYLDHPDVLALNFAVPSSVLAEQIRNFFKKAEVTP